MQGEVVELLNHYKMMTKSAGKLATNAKKMNSRNMPASMAQMQQALPPQLLHQMQAAGGGGMGGMQDMMKAMQQMQGKGGMPKMPF
jgi:hypothetical protein